MIKDCATSGTQHSGAVLRGRVAMRHPVGMFPHEERDRRDARRDDAPRARIGQRRMWRNPSPSDGAAQTQTIQSLRIVLGNAPHQDVALPTVGWSLEAL